MADGQDFRGWEEEIKDDLAVNFVGGFDPGPNMTGVFYRAGVKPSDLAGWNSVVMPAGAVMGGLEEPPTKFMSSGIDLVLKARPKLVDWLQKN